MVLVSHVIFFLSLLFCARMKEEASENKERLRCHLTFYIFEKGTRIRLMIKWSMRASAIVRGGFSSLMYIMYIMYVCVYREMKSPCTHALWH